MSLVTTTETVNGVELVRTASDAGRYVTRDGQSFVEAYDPAGSGRTYEEGDPIDADELEATAASILDVLLGGSDD